MKIIRTNKQVVTDIPHEGLIKIKDALTFPNPAYASAKRYSRSRYITIPPYLEYYKQSMFNDVNGKRKLRLEIPIGFNVSSLLPEEPIEVIDKRVSKEVKYPPFVLELRPDQEKAKQAYLNNINNEEFINEIKSLNPDVICVVAYGKILPKEILDIPRLGCINVHGSLLPKYRGAAPMQWAIINGETVTGITTMYMAKGLDSGDMLLKKEVTILRNLQLKQQLVSL